MYSGVFSADELTRVFRSISQKRRQGVLEIQLGSHTVFITFHNGKIIDAGQSEKPSTLGICERLVVSGKMSGDQIQECLDQSKSVADLCKTLVERGLCTRGDFLAAKTVYQMDTLYSLRKAGRGHYEFTPKMTRNEEEFSLNLAPGQLLLDMMELDSEESRFTGVVATLSAKDSRIVAANQGVGQLSTGEEALCSVLDESSCLEEICQRTLLTEYQLRTALLALFDKKLLKMEKKAPAIEQNKPSRPISQEGKIVSEESVSADMITNGALLLSALEEESEEEDGLSELDLDLPEEDSALDLDESLEVSYLAESEEEAPDREADKEVEEEADLLESIDDEVTERINHLPDATGQERLSTGDRIRHLNFWMLHPDNFSNVALVINLLFLFVVSLIAPSLFNQWFDALSFFNEY